MNFKSSLLTLLQASPLEALQLQDIAGWDTAISIEINYHLEDHPFNCDLLLLFNDQSADEIRMVLDGMINI